MIFTWGYVVQTTTTSDLNYTFSAPAGTYKVRVTDASSCFKETSDITLTQPDPISTNNISNVSCNGGRRFIYIILGGQLV